VLLPRSVHEDTEDGAEVADGAAFLVVGTSSMYGAQTGASSAFRMRSRRFRRSVDPSSVSTTYERGVSCCWITRPRNHCLSCLTRTTSSELKRRQRSRAAVIVLLLLELAFAELIARRNDFRYQMLGCHG